METERETMERGRQELARTESLQKDLEKAHKGYREVVAQKERLEEGKYSMLQQLNDANERERKNLQLIRDLEQEIRLNVNGRLQADLISVWSGTATAAFADRIAISDQVGSQLDSTESSPAVHQHDILSSSPHATDAAREARQLREINGILTNGTIDRSTEPLSPPSSPSPIHATVSAEPMRQPFKTNNVPQDDNLGPNLAPDVPPRRCSDRSVAGGNRR
jgi:hypothetical protein